MRGGESSLQKVSMLAQKGQWQFHGSKEMVFGRVNGACGVAFILPAKLSVLSCYKSGKL